MINLRAAAKLGLGYGRRQMAAIGLALDDVIKPVEPFGAVVGGFPMRIPKRGEYVHRQRRRRDEALMLALLR